VEAEDVEAELLATEDDALSERLDDALAELVADSWRGRLRRLRIPHRVHNVSGAPVDPAPLCRPWIKR
jgi:hypothetical protein